MNNRPLVARAFELAPECSSLKELRKKLRAEGYTLVSIEMHLDGGGIQRELQKLYNGGAGAKKRGPKPR
jgi:hypothetical protein